MSLANDPSRSKYRPHHRNAKGLAAAGISVRDNPALWLPRRPTATHADGAAKPPCWIKMWGLV